MDSMLASGTEPEPAAMSVHSDDSDDDESIGGLFDDVKSEDNIDDHTWQAEEEGGVDGPSIAELVLMLVDYVSAHKLTQLAAEDCWNLLRIVCPPSTRPRGYNLVRGLVQRHLRHTLVKVDVCVNGCVAFYDCKSTKLLYYRYADLDECPTCGACRYVRKQGQRVAARVMWWLPSKYYWQYIFSHPDIVPRLANDNCPSQSTQGGVRKSAGWRHKVTNNPNINQDYRHQAAVLSLDGMPFFKHLGCRSGWPMFLRSANLDMGLWNDPAYTHMLAFYPSDYWQQDHDDDDKIVRVQGYAHSDISHLSHNYELYTFCTCLVGFAPNIHIPNPLRPTTMQSV